MGLPSKLKNFAVFVDGENYMGEVPEVTLPTLSRKVDEYRGGGMNAPVDLDYGMEKLEAEIKAGGWMGDMLKTWGDPKLDAVMLRFTGAVQADDTGVVQACECVLRGRFSEWDPGDAKAGDPTEHTYKLSVNYYKLSMDGRAILEIDPVNLTEIVGGEDRMADIKAALGV